MDFSAKRSGTNSPGYGIDLDEGEIKNQELFERGKMAREASDAAIVDKKYRLEKYLELDDQLNAAMADDSECLLFAAPGLVRTAGV